MAGVSCTSSIVKSFRFLLQSETIQKQNFQNVQFQKVREYTFDNGLYYTALFYIELNNHYDELDLIE